MNPLRLIGVSLIILSTGCQGSQPRVVLYCAQDREFAEDLFGQFKSETGITVAPKFDTEANKSVSLYFEIVRENDRPRCDVFWNNEILSTIRLQKQGLLVPYPTPKGMAYPHADDHSWYAFVARARVLIVNTQLLEENARPRALLELTQERWKDDVVMAKPEFGTSATQAACLFQVMGKEKAESFYRGLKANGVQIAPGNKQVAEWVGQGRTPSGKRVAVGITDTDDAMAEVKAGRPVTIIFPDRDGMGTLFIPNTVAIVAGGPNVDGARKLLDFLLSDNAELALADNGWHFSLRKGHEKLSPLGLEAHTEAKRMAVDFSKAADLWDEVQAFLGKEFGP
jgi:iron(III) transport system substrate-binding protein